MRGQRRTEVPQRLICSEATCAGAGLPWAVAVTFLGLEGTE